MLIDWFTVVAQAVNFIVLVWLLKRFLYKPIVTAMDAREQKIASQLRGAEQKKSEAESEAAKFRAAHDQFEQQKQSLFRQAESEAEALRQRLKEEARQEIEKVREEWREALRDEQGAFRANLANRVREEVFSIARNVLADLGGIDVERQIAAVFVRRLEKLNVNERDQITSMFSEAREPTIIRTGFELPGPARAAIETAVTRLRSAGTDRGVQYEIAPELVGGIELAADGHKICWSIADYLSSLERKVERLTVESAKNDGHVE
jgi:F-type H+-transporting ATPase subunit b